MEQQRDLFFESDNGKILKVVETSFIQERRMTFDELFDGFDEMFAVTYSSDVSMMNKLFYKFNYSEVIFGWPKVFSKEQRTLFDIPNSILKYYGKNKNLRQIAEFLSEGKVKFLTLHDLKAHSKLYILRSGNKHRIITGSANMSTPAMYGVQREIINYDESDAAYDYYMSRYTELLSHSGEINKNILLNLHTKKVESIDQAIADADVKDLIGTNKVVIIEGVESFIDDNNDLPVAVLDPDARKMSKKDVEGLFGKRELSSEGRSKIIILPEQLVQQKKLIVSNKEKSADYDLPIIEIDYMTNEIILNHEIINSVPPKELIRSDINCIEEYFKGLQHLKGDINRTINDYWKFLCWYLSTPFIARLRLVASRKGYDVYHRLNCVGVLYGLSNAGKTNFCRFVTKMMDGKYRLGLSVSDFTPAKINQFRSCKNGFPIFFEDADPGNKWTQVENQIVKDDTFGVSDGWDLYPCVVVCMNKANSFKVESKKRCISFRIDAGFESEYEYENSGNFHKKVFSISNNFYKYYLIKMIEEVTSIETAMIDGCKDFEYNISVVSSKVIVSIIKETLGYQPEFMYELSGKEDFVSDKVSYQAGINTLLQTIALNNESFYIKERENKLIFTETSLSFNNPPQIKFLRQELPIGWRTMDNSQIPNVLVINLDKVKETGISLRKIRKDSWIERLKDRILK